MRSIKALVHVVFKAACLTLLSQGGFADEISDRESIDRSVDQINAITKISLQGHYVSDSVCCETLRFERLGSKWFFEGDLLNVSQGRPSDSHRSRLKKAKSLLGKDAPGWMLFDGERSYEYRPGSLTLSVRDTNIGPARPYVTPFDPTFWTKPFQAIELSFWLVEAKYDRDSDGKSVFRKALEPAGPAVPVAYRNLSVKFDKEQGWNWIEFEMNGGALGKYKQTRTWKSSGDAWYPSSGTLEREDKVLEKWEISHLSFEIENIHSSFIFDESLLPVGVRIEEGESGSKKSIRFAGGAEGSRVHQLLKNAESLGRSMIDEKRD